MFSYVSFRILRFVIEEFQKLVDLKEKTINLQVVIILMKILPFIHFLSTTKVQSGVYSVIDNKLLKFVKQFLRKESGYVYRSMGCMHFYII